MGWKYLNAPLLWAQRINSEFQYFSVSVGNLNNSISTLVISTYFQFLYFSVRSPDWKASHSPSKSWPGPPLSLHPLPTTFSWNMKYLHHSHISCISPASGAPGEFACTWFHLRPVVLHLITPAPAPLSCTCTTTHLVTSPLGEAGGVPTTLVTPEQWRSLVKYNDYKEPWKHFHGSSANCVTKTLSKSD